MPPPPAPHRNILVQIEVLREGLINFIDPVLSLDHFTFQGNARVEEENQKVGDIEPVRKHVEAP